MEVAMPMANTSTTTSTMDSYEDMFKEITRKLYGEDGLPDVISNEKVTCLTSSSERSGLNNIDYDVDSNVFKPDEHITAFGLAALMQNGLSSGSILNSNFQQSNKLNSITEDKWITNEDSLQWTQSKIASYNPTQKLFKCIDCDCVGFLIRVAEHWLGTHANLRVFQCPQCPYASAWARCVRMHIVRQHNVTSEETVDNLLKDNPVMHEITRYLQTLKSKYEPNSYSNKNASSTQSNTESVSQNKQDLQSPQRNINGSPCPPVPSGNNDNSTNRNTNITSKRYSCSYCPYATDRRDLFTRHENIHREEKPFQCYICQKQFNRADHVKKHFLRMHREHPYDLNRIRRQPPKNASGMSYYHKYNNNDVTGTNSIESVTNVQQVIQHQLTIPNGFSFINRPNQNAPISKSNNTNNNNNNQITNNNKSNVKVNSSSKSNCKKKGDKKYSCCYCSWSGVDNWCLKRHLNTHLKPFVCGLCDYKAARSERLATHVLKVHNKRACGRCLYLADDQTQLTAHQQEHHSLDQRNNKSSNSNNMLRNTSYNTQNSTNQSFSQSLGPVTPSLKSYDISAAILQHGSRLLPMTNNFLSNTNPKPWKSYTPKQHGAARLFNYMEASDGSDPECETSINGEDVNRITSSTNRSFLDFFEAGDVGIQNNGENEEVEEDMELPLFMCRECGCEFIDDISLETHIYTHHQVEKIPTSPGNKKSNNKKNVSYKKQTSKLNTLLSNKKLDSKENLNPKSSSYVCMICKLNFNNQIGIMNHMRCHINFICKKKEISNKKHNLNKKDICEDSNAVNCYQNNISTYKRSRKQSQPRKVVSPSYDNQEIQVMKGTSLKNRQWQWKNGNNIKTLTKLREKYINKLITKRGLSCTFCKKGQSLFPYHSKSSLATHYIFKHMNVKKYKCEHCPMKFTHRYQVVLHSSRKHVNNLNQSQSNISSETSDKQQPQQIVPKLNNNTNNNKETTAINCNVTVPAPNNLQNINTLLNLNVPDNTTSNVNMDKLNIHSFLEQSLINQSNSVSNNMPITIPTFPPS